MLGLRKHHAKTSDTPASAAPASDPPTSDTPTSEAPTDATPASETPASDAPMAAPLDTYDGFDRLFEEWTLMLPMWQPRLLAQDWAPQDMIRVEEYQEGETLVVRAELLGMDPEKDVEITVSGGMLCIRGAHLEEDESEDEDGYVRQELRYGSFTRELPLPEGVTASDVKASYHDGLLEIRIPSAAPSRSTTIPITKD